MVAPFVQTRLTGKNNDGGSTHSILLPPVSVGDLLLVVFSSDGGTTVTVDQGNNWTKLGQRQESTSIRSCTGAIFWKIAQGGDFLTLKTSSSQMTCWVVYRISGASAVSGSHDGVDDFFDRDVDPPSHTTNLPGKDEYLWIATRHVDEISVPSSAPPGFTNTVTTANSDSDNGVTTSAAELISEDETVNPGKFGEAICWVAFTLCIEPEVLDVDVSASLTGKLTVAIAHGAGAVSPRFASLAGVATLKLEKTNTAVHDIIAGMKTSFARTDHDWRMMSASHYQHRSYRSETMLIPDPNDPNKFIPVTNTITTVHRNEMYALESQPLGIGVSVQADFENGNLEEMILHFNGSTWDIVDLELLDLLQQKGSITRNSVRDILTNLITNDPPLEEEE